MMRLSMSVDGGPTVSVGVDACEGPEERIALAAVECLARALGAPPIERREKTAGEFRIVIDAQADGRLRITQWRGERWDASYGTVDRATALGRCLPQAIDEVVAYARVAQEAR